MNTDPLWYSPSSLKELSALYNDNIGSKIKLVSGGTGGGEITMRHRCQFMPV